MENDDIKKGDESKNEGETISKVDFDKVSGERDKYQKDLDDARAEIFSQDYMDFLDKKDKPNVEIKKEEAIPDEKFEKMSKKEIFELATKTALDQINQTIEKDKTTRKTQTESARQREIARFSITHTDYEKFRPAMYGLSLKAENKDMNLQELYDGAKKYVKSLQEEPTAEEKIKLNSMSGGLKPGQDSGTYTSNEKIDGDAAAHEAAEETAEKLGPLPSA